MDDCQTILIGIVFDNDQDDDWMIVKTILFGIFDNDQDGDWMIFKNFYFFKEILFYFNRYKVMWFMSDRIKFSI